MVFQEGGEETGLARKLFAAPFGQEKTLPADGGAHRLPPLLISALPAVLVLQRCSCSRHVGTLQGEHDVTALALTLEA